MNDERTFGGMTLSEYLDQPSVTAVGLGMRLGVSHTTVLRWAAKQVPAGRVLDVATATGLAPAHLRPDLAAAFRTPASRVEAA